MSEGRGGLGREEAFVWVFLILEGYVRSRKCVDKWFICC